MEVAPEQDAAVGGAWVEVESEAGVELEAEAGDTAMDADEDDDEEGVRAAGAGDAAAVAEAGVEAGPVAVEQAARPALVQVDPEAIRPVAKAQATGVHSRALDACLTDTDGDGAPPACAVSRRQLAAPLDAFILSGVVSGAECDALRQCAAAATYSFWNPATTKRSFRNSDTVEITSEAVAAGPDQGLPLVAFSAQLEPCLSQENTLHTLHIPYHPLNTGYTTPAPIPYPIQSAQVQLKSGRL
jgi:hypothetical protein